MHCQLVLEPVNEYGTFTNIRIRDSDARKRFKTKAALTLFLYNILPLLLSTVTGDRISITEIVGSRGSDGD